MLAPWIEQFVNWLCQLLEGDLAGSTFIIYGGLAIFLVCVVCGGTGSLVIGNRQAFFADALAHCAFAGVAIGILTALALGQAITDIRVNSPFITWTMIAFGVFIGLAIAYVREKTGLSNDTVIGVFFAGAIGLGAMLTKVVSTRGYFNLENFLFGNPNDAKAGDIEALLWLALATMAILGVLYNHMVFASYSPSLALSRQVPIRLCHYLFVALLGVIVNLSIQIVGALLINAMLIVPAATAANLSGNLRQFYRRSVALAVLFGLGGYWIVLNLTIPYRGEKLSFGVCGVIVVVSVLGFFLSMAPPLKRLFGQRKTVTLPYSAPEPTITGRHEHSPQPKT